LSPQFTNIRKERSFVMEVGFQTTKEEEFWNEIISLEDSREELLKQCGVLESQLKHKNAEINVLKEKIKVMKKQL